MGKHITDIILIAGPTASGKSQLALEIASRRPTVIINADSMQVYDDLCILTARPTKDEMERVPHLLYGVVDGAQAFSVGNWLEHVRDILNYHTVRQSQVIFVGGTGLYFRALAGGLAAMPEIPSAIREYWRQRLASQGANQLHGELRSRDPAYAQRLQPADGQRIIRALEILEHTGKSLLFWHAQKFPSLIEMAKAKKILVLPEREQLYHRINMRLDKMLAQGAVEEVRRLLNRGLDAQLPVMKAIGVREFGCLLRGEIESQEAVARAKQETRRYAKRQLSWLRNQMRDENWQIFADSSRIPDNF